MIILFSILLLLFLVYLGVRMREGMTLKEADDLLQILADHYSRSDENEYNKVDNTDNEKETVRKIHKLNITDKPWIDILNGTGAYADYKADAKIAAIKNIIIQRINNKGKYKMTADKFKKLLKQIEDTNENPNKSDSDKARSAKSIVVNDLNDDRFTHLWLNPIADDKDDRKLIQQIKTTISNILDTDV
jgi:hypothetical protein